MDVEGIIRWLGGLAAWGTLGVLMVGIWLGVRRTPGRVAGKAAGWLRSTVFYVLALTAFLVFSVWGWKAFPGPLPAQYRRLMLLAGCLLYFPGIGLVLWGRITLGRMYFVSTSMGALLFADHRLITNGPFAWVRHPMYVGLIATALGSLLIYANWTTLAFALTSPFVLLRARREEQVLAAAFGEEWRKYCARVPAFLPRWRRKRQSKTGPHVA